MNIDLNLEPFVHPPEDDHPHNITFFEDLLPGSTLSHRLPPVGAASVAAVNNGTPPEPLKPDETDNESTFFDCNICLDLASDPVVTCCGHLFCWPCIYRWLFVHSNAKQCPICKGEVTMKSITPIYSRSKSKSNRPKAVHDPNSSFKIPCRPLANRVESWRQSFQRDTLNFPIIDMVRRLDSNRFSLSRDPMSTNQQDTHLLNRIFTSRGIRRGRDSVPASAPDVTVDLVNDHVLDITSAESFVDSYFRDHPDERNENELSLVDSHSMSSVGGVIIQSEVVTAGTGSRRRRDPSTSRVWDVDRANSNSRPRRRRLH